MGKCLEKRKSYSPEAKLIRNINGLNDLTMIQSYAERRSVSSQGENKGKQMTKTPGTNRGFFIEFTPGITYNRDAPVI